MVFVGVFGASKLYGVNATIIIFVFVLYFGEVVVLRCGGGDGVFVGGSGVFVGGGGGYWWWLWVFVVRCVEEGGGGEWLCLGTLWWVVVGLGGCL